MIIRVFSMYPLTLASRSPEAQIAPVPQCRVRISPRDRTFCLRIVARLTAVRSVRPSDSLSPPRCETEDGHAHDRHSGSRWFRRLPVPAAASTTLNDNHSRFKKILRPDLHPSATTYTPAHANPHPNPPNPALPWRSRTGSAPMASRSLNRTVLEALFAVNAYNNGRQPEP